MSFMRSISVTLGGWLWADILLGLFVIFVAANSVGAPPVIAAPTAAPTLRPGLDPIFLPLTIKVDGAALLGRDRSATEAEQARIRRQVEDELGRRGESRRVALILAYGSYERPTDGDTIARLGADSLSGAQFKDAVVKTFHDLVPGDQGTTLSLELYFFQ